MYKLFDSRQIHVFFFLRILKAEEEYILNCVIKFREINKLHISYLVPTICFGVANVITMY
jgi:hypothetical protein